MPLEQLHDRRVRTRHPMTIGTVETASIRAVETDQHADARRLSGRNVRRTVADAPAAGEIELQVGRRLQQHAGSRLAPRVLASKFADTGGGVVRTMVDSVDARAAALELAAHPRHQMFELLHAEQASTDARLVGHDGDGESALDKGTHHLEDTVDESAVLDTMQIAGVLVDYAVAIEKEPRSSHHQPAVLSPSSACRSCGAFL
jgi:hypothetical protein